MANLTSGKVWALDSVVGIVSSTPVNIHSIIVNWASASVGQLVLQGYQGPGSSFGEPILSVYTLTIGTVGTGLFGSQQYFMGNQTFSGLTKVTVTGLQPTALMIVTGCQNG